jgi:hypothetical protein
MRLVGIPATVGGIALAIIFFKVYGLVSRPDVPRPIAILVDQFAPGVEIGARVSDMKHAVPAMTYVPHLGFVGMPGQRGANLPDGYSVRFEQVRLLLDETTRRQPNPNPAKARVDAVEVVTSESIAAGEIGQAFNIIFRKPPRLGCLHMSDESRLRDVQTWATPNERGGISIISDYRPDPKVRPSGPVITNVIAFVGNFDGGRTLRANYTDASCMLVVGER